MERFYSWRYLKHCPSHGTIETLVLCYKRCQLTEGNVYTDVETALKSDANLPDCVYIVGSTDQCNTFKAAWNPANTHLQTMIKRGMKAGFDFVKQYTFVEWDGANFRHHALGHHPSSYEVDLKHLMSRGVHSLIEKNNAVHQAPSGHVFKHPSQRRNKVFIQAREIASGEAELYVVAYLIALCHGNALNGSTKVFIDTMGIYAYIKCALVLCRSEAEIVSFHSYDELEKVNPPSEPYFCIISASTSGSMARKMAGSVWDPQRIATIVDVTSHGRAGDVMVALDSMGVSFPDLKVNDGTLIEIIGENFSSKAKPPRPVVIGQPHTPKALAEFHEYFGFSIHPFNTQIATKNKLLLLDVTKVLEHEEFQKWLDAEIDWSFPLTVSHVIHADDEASKALAKIVVDRLSARLSTGSSITVISNHKLEKDNCKDATGVVIVSTVARDGGVLREISRDLRSYIKAGIPRHFLSPIGIPQTSESWNQLRTFLVRNSTSREYGFSNWIHLPLGEDSNDNSWHRLITTYQAHSDKSVAELGLGHLPDTSNILASVELAGKAASNAFQKFLLSPRGNTLSLSEGFLFFGDKTDIAKRYTEVESSMVHLTMSAVLQNAREHKDHERRLCPNGYESVVLSPECFLRFNEAILQASMLRACHPAELDYSSSPELSKVMKELLVKVFARWDKDFGDAALEFAAAIAVGSLRLAKRDMETLLDGALKQHAGKESELLGMLVLAKQAND
ncbi:TPA: hypothetical protein VDV84_002283 [Pseudomonas aeruginosa]|nr:hypothetical protein [Pseudomonas aeruginosa]HBO2549554.1 hypothetical protein [Pseudomonas aeruginosa]HBO2581226.1 hypothetical protein [Pseudomonas aeruginosa]HBO2600035.1 hypothetical protein [Pseudomonas aeruginosa]HCK0545447.1 hypothetical protein [Pseudomonas aeruginosa]